MVKITTTTSAAPFMVSTPCAVTSVGATPTWQMPNALAVPATRVRTLIGATAAGYGTSGFAASAVIADKHSRQAKPAAPPRGSR